MNSSLNIFTVKTVKFEDGERDPFGFDNFAAGLGEEYLPFSGTVAKPAYYIFVAYVNRILKEKSIPWKTKKEKKQIQQRLEKLLVYCWKKSVAKDELRGSAILGNSFDINDIDVFTSRGWIKQNVFKIYTERNFAPETLQYYWGKIGEKQIPKLSEFISIEYKQQKHKSDNLKELIKSLCKKNSLFNYHQLESGLKKRFKNELYEKIAKKNKPKYLQYLNRFFDNKSFKEEVYWNKLLENKKLPFAQLNDWFPRFVKAVDEDINNKSNKASWDAADKAFDKIESKYHKNSNSEIVIDRRQKPNKWFQYKDGKYSLREEGNKSEKRRIKNLWDSYMKRQGEEVGAKYFFNYRHYALFRLLKELQ